MLKKCLVLAILTGFVGAAYCNQQAIPTKSSKAVVILKTLRDKAHSCLSCAVKLATPKRLFVLAVAAYLYKLQKQVNNMDNGQINIMVEDGLGQLQDNRLVVGERLPLRMANIRVNPRGYFHITAR